MPKEDGICAKPECPLLNVSLDIQVASERDSPYHMIPNVELRWKRPLNIAYARITA